MHPPDTWEIHDGTCIYHHLVKAPQHNGLFPAHVVQNLLNRAGYSNVHPNVLCSKRINLLQQYHDAHHEFAVFVKRFHRGRRFPFLGNRDALAWHIRQSHGVDNILLDMLPIEDLTIFHDAICESS